MEKAYKKAKIKPSLPLKQYDSLWLKRTLKAPGAWKDRAVNLHIKRIIGDMAVYVNGKRIGEILAPCGTLDISGALKFGEDNDIRLWVTTACKGVSKEKNHYFTRKNWKAGIQRIPELIISNKTYITDVFANTSFRKKKLTVETEIISPEKQTLKLKTEIIDEKGKIVKSKIDKINLKAGTEEVIQEISWQNPHYWEIGAPYLYTCKTELLDDKGQVINEFPTFKFGFREFWRDGKELYLNGHIQRLRTVYSFHSKAPGVNFLNMVGYNTIHYSHRFDTFQEYDKPTIEYMDQKGIACLAGAPYIGKMRDKIRKDPKAREEYERHMKLNMRQYRNHPSMIGWYLTVNMICPRWNMWPEKLGQIAGKGPGDKNINAAAAIGKKHNPNTIFFAHADGSNGDMSSSNLYLNFTPLQEREEWLSQWSEKGTFPWHGAEFGQIYYGSYWQRRNFIFTELMAIYYGEKAYQQEPAVGLANTVDMSIDNVSHHGTTNKNFSLFKDYPIFWDFQKEITWRTNRSWRTFGLNGGLIHFNLKDSYGIPPDRKKGGCDKYGYMKKFYKSKPEWANPAFDIYQLGNKDFLGYIGGYPLHTDKTHAYYSGKEIEKQAVFVWDGPGKKEFKADWKMSDKSGNKIAGGSFSEKMSTGEIKFHKISVKAPNVKVKTSYKFELTYYEKRNNKEKEIFRDSLNCEVYPNKIPQIAFKETVKIIDPSGKDIAILKKFGIKYKVIKQIKDIGKSKYLIIGKNALENNNIDLNSAQLAEGLQILVLPQTPKSWQSLGFKVQDTMSRLVFLRDKNNPAFANITPEMLQNWAGAPDYGKPYGAVMNHDNQRGPRWTRNMTVAGLMLQIPERSGFIPLIDGEFDLNFAALLRYKYGKGDITFCTLDFEDRVGIAPAATNTAGSGIKRLSWRKTYFSQPYSIQSHSK